MLVIRIKRKDGKEEVIKKEDTGTWWFARIFAALLNYTAKGGKEEVQVKAEDGSTVTLTVKDSKIDNLFNSTANGDSGCLIAIGDAKQYSSRDQYILYHEIARAKATAEPFEQEGYVTIKASFPFSSSALIYEVGLYYKDPISGKCILLDRTYLCEFSDRDYIAVDAGETLIIEYRLYSQFIV